MLLFLTNLLFLEVCFLSSQPIQRRLFFLKAIESPFGSFCFTPAGKNFRFACTVPVISVFLDNKNSEEEQQCTNYLYKGGNPCQVKAASILHIYHETNHVHCNFYFCLCIWKNYLCSQLNFRINRTTWIQICGDACLAYIGLQVPYLQNQSNFHQ